VILITISPVVLSSAYISRARLTWENIVTGFASTSEGQYRDTINRC